MIGSRKTHVNARCKQGLCVIPCSDQSPDISYILTTFVDLPRSASLTANILMRFRCVLVLETATFRMPINFTFFVIHMSVWFEGHTLLTCKANWEMQLLLHTPRFCSDIKGKVGPLLWLYWSLVFVFSGM